MRHASLSIPIYRSCSYRSCSCVFAFLSLSIFWGIPLTSSALEADQAQPIEIEADSAVLDEQKAMAIYKGKVELIQGTLKITAQQLTVWSIKNQIEKLEALGDPATYTQSFEDNSNPIDAVANNIYYFPTQGKVILEMDAHITQGQHRFEGNHIEYDIKKQLLSAKGQSSETGKNMSRVKIVIPPQNKENTEKEGQK